MQLFMYDHPVEHTILGKIMWTLYFFTRNIISQSSFYDILPPSPPYSKFFFKMKILNYFYVIANIEWGMGWGDKLV